MTDENAAKPHEHRIHIQNEPGTDFPVDDPDKEKDFEALAEILNRIQERHGVTLQPRWTATHDFTIGDDLGPPITLEPATLETPSKLYDLREAKAIEAIATARGMLLADIMFIAEDKGLKTAEVVVSDEIEKRSVELLTQALGDLL